MPTATTDKPKRAGSIAQELQRKELDINPTRLEEGQILEVYHFAKVDRVYNRGSMDQNIQVTNVDTGMPFQVHGRDLIGKCWSADLYEETIELPRTKILEILATLYNVPFTACWIKQDEKTKASGQGDTTTRRCRLIGPDPFMGRFHAEDLDKEIGKRQIQIDCRTLQYLIVKGVKYVSNSK